MHKMNMTAGQLKENLRGIPDDYEIWIEYPAKYGIVKPEKVAQIEDEFTPGEFTDFIESLGCYIVDHENKRFMIKHHF